MSDPLEQTIAQDGYAQVIVIFSDGARARLDDAALLARHFIDPDLTGEQPPAAVLRSAPAEGLASTAAAELVRMAGPARHARPVRVYPLLGLALGFVDETGLASLRQAPGISNVVAAELPGLVRPVQARLCDPPGEQSWGVARLGAPALWRQGHRGGGILVGHIDTGVDGGHPALAGAVAHFVEFDLAGNEVDGNGAWDSDDHGTHIAGTMLGRPVNGGAFGMAPEASLASAMVMEGGNVAARLLGGLEWNVARKVRVLNASIGLRGQGSAFRALVDALRARDVLPAFAVGNEGEGTSRYPGNYRNVLSVGACDRDGFVADFSGSQLFLRPERRTVPDLVAPGDDIVSCVPNGFARMSGTSMAAAHVSGLAALLFSAEPAASASDVEQAIAASCARSGGMDPARGNQGIPDASRALAALRGERPSAPSARASAIHPPRPAL